MVDVVDIPANMFYQPGFMDANIIAMPVWAWIIFIMFFVAFIGAIGMLYVWLVMKPVLGYGKVGDASTAKGSPTQVFSIWKNRSFVIESMWYYGNVLAYGNPLKQMQMWFHNSEKATGVSANKPVMLTRDGFDGTVDLIAEMAVCEIPKIFNHDYGFEVVPKTDIEGKQIVDADTGSVVTELKERKDPSGKPYRLNSFADIRERMGLLEKLYPDGIPIRIYQQYDLSDIYKFTPQCQDSLKFGTILVDDARELALESDKPLPGLMDKYGLLLICLVVGIVSTAFVMMSFPIK